MRARYVPARLRRSASERRRAGTRGKCSRAAAPSRTARRPPPRPAAPVHAAAHVAEYRAHAARPGPAIRPPPRCQLARRAWFIVKAVARTRAARSTLAVAYGVCWALKQMQRYEILHRTYYNFTAAVQLGPHGLRLRPREGHELRVESVDVRPR